MQAILFDLDGTLIDTAADICAALNLVLKEYQQPPCQVEQIKPYMSVGLHAILANVLGKHLSFSDLFKYNQGVLKYYPEVVGRFSDYFAGTEAVLNKIYENKMPWGIVTNKLESLAQMLIDAKNIKPGVLVGGDTCRYSKPHPEPLLYACKQLAVDPKQCLFVGDDIKDMQAGERAGMQTVAIDYGYGIVDDSWGYTYRIKAADELLALL